MINSRLALAFAGLSLPLFAQESYWIANRASNDIMRVSPWGSVLERVATPTALRSCTVAPDGKVWIVRFIQPTFDIYDPATATLTPVPSPGGSPYQVAFDANGRAWMSNGATAVHEFDANGTFLQTYTLSAGAALGITVDAAGNKWIAHRASPASVSRIDPNGAVANFPIVGATMQPVTIVADYRGILQPSRIWVVGDGAAQLAEIDSTTGATLNLYTPPMSAVGSLTFDRAGRIWLGSSSGALLQLDETNGSVLQTLAQPPSIIGLATDTQGRILATERVTFSGVGPPCELRRIDPITGTLEVPGFLTFGGNNASGTQAPASTPWQYSLVAGQLGDMDGDGEANVSEILAGTSPIDPQATTAFRIESFGSTQNGNTPRFEVQSGLLWVVGYATARAATPAPVPGIAGLARIDLTTLITTSAGFGNASLPIAIPANPALAGFEFFAQGVTWDGAQFEFRNASGMIVW